VRAPALQREDARARGPSFANLRALIVRREQLQLKAGQLHHRDVRLLRPQQALCERRANVPAHPGPATCHLEHAADQSRGRCLAARTSDAHDGRRANLGEQTWLAGQGHSPPPGLQHDGRRRRHTGAEEQHVQPIQAERLAAERQAHAQILERLERRSERLGGLAVRQRHRRAASGEKARQGRALAGRPDDRYLQAAKRLSRDHSRPNAKPMPTSAATTPTTQARWVTCTSDMPPSS